jgi:FkbM family methyltransferase
MTTYPSYSGTETHPKLRKLTRSVLSLPFAKQAVRKTARFAIQTVPLSQRSKQRVYNLVSADAVPACPVTCSVKLPGGGHLRLELDIHDDLSRRWYYWGYTNYEQSTVRLWTRLLESAKTVFDVGANVGLYTLLAAERLRGRGLVHAFEPNPSVFTWLVRNAHLNSLDSVRATQFALSDSDGEAAFFLPKNNAWTNGSLIEGFTVQTEAVRVKTRRLDTYCADLDVSAIDLIKIDVEGAELKVLAGMGDLLEKLKPDLICEVLDRYAGSLNEFFGKLPYRKFLITAQGLKEVGVLVPHHQFRDYYLSCAPVLG